ncbi:MAG TPA: class I SAM-dependent methyltransferase [Longimicrobium sp.]|nr:class I SAM-dependent methyltransferase [Longimicrobium sp.]
MGHPDDDPTTGLARSWEANADAWTRAVREGRIESRRVATDDAILRAILDRAPRRVLDVGCGEGWLCRALAEHGIDAIGVDGSAPLIRAARARGGRFHVCSYEDLLRDPEQLGVDEFGVIVFNFALLHEDIAPLLQAVRPALRYDDGVLIIQTVHPWIARGDGPYADGWRTERFAAFGDEFPQPMPWYYRTVGSWIAAVNAAGYLIGELREPAHPETSDPLSLLLIARPADRA